VRDAFFSTDQVDRFGRRVQLNGVCAAASMLMPESSGLAGSIMLEWLFILDARSKNL
jgi:hypothetical protein